VIDKDAVAELMGSVAFGLIAGFGGLCLAVALSSLFVAVDASNFWPYALAGFAVGAPVGLLGYRLRERFVEGTLEVQ